MARHTMWLLAGVASAMVSACTVSDPAEEVGNDYAGSASSTSDDGSDDGGGSGSGSDDAGDSSDDAGAQGVTLSTGCAAYGSDVYTPYPTNQTVSSGNPATYPWRGRAASYPDSIEDFRAYSAGASVECGANKSARDYLDVTAGCLKAVAADGGVAGEIHGTSVSEGYYRSFALPYDQQRSRPVAWTDMGVEYRFKYSQWTSNVSGPGFKAFVRYLTEYDLYVASWRMDGTVQIQKKQCGTYTILKRNGSYGQPSPNVWHTMRFEVVGSELRLYLDGRLAMTTTDSSIKRGTTGIRIDSAEGALIDDWRTYAP